MRRSLNACSLPTCIKLSRSSSARPRKMAGCSAQAVNSSTEALIAYLKIEKAVSLVHWLPGDQT